jgi:hypothetical protein
MMDSNQEIQIDAMLYELKNVSSLLLRCRTSQDSDQNQVSICRKFLNLQLLSSVYRVVFWMLACPSHSCEARGSWASL